MMNYDYTDYDTFGFKREDIEKLLGFKFPVAQSSCVKVQGKNIICSDEEDSLPVEWSTSAGMETAKMFIAGLAVALSKSGSCYRRGGKINKSAVIDAAIKSINEFGVGVTLTDKALRNLLDSALKQHTSNLGE